MKNKKNQNNPIIISRKNLEHQIDLKRSKEIVIKINKLLNAGEMPSGSFWL